MIAGEAAFINCRSGAISVPGALETFNRVVQQLPTVEQCHMIAGGFDYLLKARTTDITVYRVELAEHISALLHVESTSTFVSMETVIE